MVSFRLFMILISLVYVGIAQASSPEAWEHQNR